MSDLLTVEGEGTLIGGGDFNQRLNAQLDSSGKTQQKNTIGKKIKKMLSYLGILDMWRELNPSKRDYTYFSAPHLVYSRIDYFVIYERD